MYAGVGWVNVRYLYFQTLHTVSSLLYKAHLWCLVSLESKRPHQDISITPTNCTANFICIDCITSFILASCCLCLREFAEIFLGGRKAALAKHSIIRLLQKPALSVAAPTCCFLQTSTCFLALPIPTTWTCAYLSCLQPQCMAITYIYMFPLNLYNSGVHDFSSPYSESFLVCLNKPGPNNLLKSLIIST